MSATSTSDYNLRRPTPQKFTSSKSVPGFDEVVNMTDFFHNKSRSSSIHSVLSDHSLTFGKPKTFNDLFKDKDFEVSPFKPSMNESAIKQKVSLVISRLEDDSAAPPSTSQNKTEPYAAAHAVSRDSGFNEVQSDSGGSSEGAFTDVMNRRSKVTSVKERRILTSVSEVNTAVGAQTVNGEEEAHISFESNSSDEEIDVVTDHDDVQVKDVDDNDNNDDDDDGGGDDDDNNNLNNKKAELSVEQTGAVAKTRKKEAHNQEKPDTNRTNKEESSNSSTSSDKVHGLVRLCSSFLAYSQGSCKQTPCKFKKVVITVAGNLQ